MLIKYLINKNHSLFINLKKSEPKTFSVHCKLLFDFFNEEKSIQSIILELKNTRIYIEDWENIHQRLMNGDGEFPDNERDLAAFSLKLLEEFSDDFTHLRFFSSKIGDGPNLISFHNLFTNSLESYIGNCLEKGNFMLYLLNKYKCQCEWFYNEELLEMYEADTGHGEEALTKNLRKFLFDNGIDYPFSEPNTPSGKPDVIYGIDTDDPLALEVKLFGGKSNYGKNYIKKGFSQALSYANDYNKSSAFLLIFNLSNKLLEFNLASENNEFISININNKNIFIVVINLNINEKSASKSRKNVVQIDEKYLIGE